MVGREATRALYFQKLCAIKRLAPILRIVAAKLVDIVVAKVPLGCTITLLWKNLLLQQLLQENPYQSQSQSPGQPQPQLQLHQLQLRCGAMASRTLMPMIKLVGEIAWTIVVIAWGRVLLRDRRPKTKYKIVKGNAVQIPNVLDTQICRRLFEANGMDALISRSKLLRAMARNHGVSRASRRWQ